MDNEIILTDNELKKHVATVHCSGALSLLQRKINNALLYNAYNNLLIEETHTITVRRLCQLIGCNSNNYAAIKQAIRGLLAQVVEWNIFDDLSGEEDWSASSILASVRIKEALCTYSYSPRMRELLHSPVIYAKINLLTQAKFKSNYGLALYENCTRYQSLHCTKNFSLDTLRKILGVAPGLYPIFRDFKRRVLDKAVEEVNTYADLRIEPELTKVGRQVVSVRFKIAARPRKPVLGAGIIQESEKAPAKYLEVLVELSRFGINENYAKKILKEFGETNVKEKILWLKNKQHKHKEQIQNPAAYLVAALKNDYKDISSEAKIALCSKEVSSACPSKDQMQDELKQAYNDYIRQEVLKRFGVLSKNEKNQILAEFGRYLGQGAFFDLFKNEGLENVLILDRFVLYLGEKHGAFCVDVLPFNLFCTQRGNLQNSSKNKLE